MKKIVTFMNNALIIPILPCFINMIIKSFCDIPFGWDFLDKGTLSFSVSLYLLTCLKGSLKLVDKDVANGVSAIYVSLLIVSIVLFSSGITFDTIYDIDIVVYVKAITEKINNGTYTEVMVFSPRFKKLNCNH